MQDGSKPRKYFPFKQGYPFVATLRVGSEGIQMTVDGKHLTSFAYREVISLILIDFLLEVQVEWRCIFELIGCLDCYLSGIGAMAC